MGNTCLRMDSCDSGLFIKDLIVPLDEIQFGDLINSGGCGQVFEGIYQGKPVAIKYGSLGPKNHKTVLSEINAMHVLDHPNIIQLYAVAESENGFYLIMERGQMNLDQCVRKGYNVNILIVLKSIVNALIYMHSFNPPYIHRDIKPSNILVMPDNSVKLSDFGLSFHDVTLGRHMSDVGTPSFIAPEVSSHSYDERVDIYSFGLLIYFLISGGQYKSNKEQNQDIFRMNFVTKTLYLLYKQCTEVDPSDRPSLQDILIRIERLIKYSKKSSSRDIPGRKQRGSNVCVSSINSSETSTSENNTNIPTVIPGSNIPLPSILPTGTSNSSSNVLRNSMSLHNPSSSGPLNSSYSNLTHYSNNGSIGNRNGSLTSISSSLATQYTIKKSSSRGSTHFKEMYENETQTNPTSNLNIIQTASETPTTSENEDPETQQKSSLSNTEPSYEELP